MGCLKSLSSLKRCDMKGNLHFSLRDRVGIVVSAILLVIIGPAGLACITGFYLKFIWMCFKLGWNSVG